MQPPRWARWLSGVWAGLLLGIGLLAAPAAFATLPMSEAGRAVGRMFAQEAYLGLVLIIALCDVERRRARIDAAAGRGSVMSVNILLLLGALFCTVAGHFAVLPMMAAARAGQGTWSFGALHGAAAGFYALKALLVCSLAWRLAG